MNPDLPSLEKPIDFGAGGIMGCLDAYGSVTALNAYHPRHGIVSVTSAPPFPEEKRYVQHEVRAYRRNLLTLKGIGLSCELPVVARTVHYAGDTPLVHFVYADNTQAECATFTYPPYGIVQIWRSSRPLEYRLEGKVWIQRSAYAQLTEGGPLMPVSAKTAFFSCESADCAGLKNEALGWALCIGADNLHVEENNEDGSVSVLGRLPAQMEHRLFYAVGENPDAAQRALTALRAQQPADFAATSAETSVDPLEDRAWRYARLCCIPVDAEGVCILTDHMILPLAWNRDSYYAARLFLCERSTWELVRRHLIWMFETAERLDGLWGRSYLANGRVKDRGFQLDQQLFPLLELADYVQITGDRATLNRLEAQIAPVFAQLERYRAPEALLFATEETPADDPIALPYPLSSHVLLWRVLTQLAAIGCSDLLPFPAEHLVDVIYAHFVGIPKAGASPIFAYATDGHGRHHFYHDANDIPLALMPVWGFCEANHPIWRATMEFAFSVANEGGYYDVGLGSVHTPAPWPLGDIQECIVARSIHENARERAALARLARAAQWDGALPEAYDGASGAVISRHWFLWPNAAYACMKRGVFDL